MRPDREWIYSNWIRDGTVTDEFIQGVEDFIAFVQKHPEHTAGDRIRCPCNKARCRNKRFQEVDTVRMHLYNKGFVKEYYTWIYHGEKEAMDTSAYDAANVLYGMSEAGCSYVESTRSMLYEALPDTVFNNIEQHNLGDCMMNEEDAGVVISEMPNSNAKKFYDAMHAAEKESWQGRSPCS